MCAQIERTSCISVCKEDVLNSLFYSHFNIVEVINLFNVQILIALGDVFYTTIFVLTDRHFLY